MNFCLFPHLFFGTAIALLKYKQTKNKEDKMTSTNNVKELDDKTFDQIISTGVTLVDFWATWCMPCRMQGPIIEKVADEIGTKAKIGKLNVDSYPDMAGKYGVMSIPTLMVFKEGKAVKTFVGVQSEQTLISAITESL